MKILAIETSCDDTCVSILKIENRKFKILSNIVSSQVKLHAKYGGVYPFMAKREHQRNLAPVLKKALIEARLLNSKSKDQSSKLQFKIQNSISKIDLLSVTIGPGLEPCLWVGLNFAKELAKSLKLPLMPVNHIEAHIFANWLKPIGKTQNSPKENLRFPTKQVKLKTQNLFPAVCLVVSGGHTQLILMKDFGKYKILGETRDDAAGECFDKTARILGLGYPGGPIISKLASQGHSSVTSVILPRPMIYQKNYDFSFSGLKTAVLYLVKQLVDELRSSSPFANARVTENGKKLTISQKRKICTEIQQAIIDVLIHKTLKAAKEYKAKSIILGGGVAANQELRKQFKQKIKKEIPNSLFLIPDSKFCTDNAAMVAITGYFNYIKKLKVAPENIKADANLRLSFESR